MTKRLTSQELTPNQQAVRNEDALFSALEFFVNTGDTAQDVRRFRVQHPQLFPAEFYDESERQSGEGRNNFFNWYKRMLRQVWEGLDSEGNRLAILLGIRPAYADLAAGELATETAEFSQIAVQTGRTNIHGAIESFYPPSVVTPNWRTGEIQYRFEIEFQRAVYALLRSSWRARICPSCGKYLVAAKPANVYCSTACSRAAKRGQARNWWRRRGSLKRKQKRSKGRNLPKKVRRNS